MIGDKPVTLFAFFTAVCVHLIVLLLMSYMPITKLEPPASPSRTRYVVQFRQPISTTTPISVPVPPTPAPAMPTRPVPEMPRPRQPVKPYKPIRIAPHHERPQVPEVPRTSPVPQVQRPNRVTARKPSDVNLRQAQKPSEIQPPKPPSPSPPNASGQAAPVPESVIPRTSPAQPLTPPAESPLQPATPATPPAEKLQNQYLAMVSEAIQRHKHYPRAARRRGLRGKVVLDFVILPNGQIAQARVITNQSTQHNILRKAALHALERASPLPPFPETLQKTSWRITLPILYELEKR